jgi:hypothetical protein
LGQLDPIESAFKKNPFIFFGKATKDGFKKLTYKISLYALLKNFQPSISLRSFIHQDHPLIQNAGLNEPFSLLE